MNGKGLRKGLKMYKISHQDSCICPELKKWQKVGYKTFLNDNKRENNKLDNNAKLILKADSTFQPLFHNPIAHCFSFLHY